MTREEHIENLKRWLSRRKVRRNKTMLTVVYDKSDKDLPCVCVMKADERLSYACLKMVIGEQAELLYRALTDQSFKIAEKEE